VIATVEAEAEEPNKAAVAKTPKATWLSFLVSMESSEKCKLSKIKQTGALRTERWILSEDIEKM
jgi:hypothetical protein